MKKFALPFLAAFALTANAGFVDFESFALQSTSLLSAPGVDITFVDGNGVFQVVTGPSDAPYVSGNAILSFFDNPGTGRFRATFSELVNLVSIGASDFTPSDDDEPYLEAYDAMGNLLDSDNAFIPTTGPGATLTVSSATAIKYVEFYELGSFAGALYWDNLSYTSRNPIPEPSTYALGAAGLALIGFLRRRS